MTAATLFMVVALAAPPVSTEFLNSSQAFQSRFEVVARFSLEVPSLSSGFTLSSDGKAIYFAAPADHGTVVLQEISLQTGVAGKVGMVYDPATDGLPYLGWYWLAAISGEPGRLLVGAGTDPGSCGRRLFILDLNTMEKVQLDTRAPKAVNGGTVAQLRSCGGWLVSPSTRYLAARLWDFSLKHTEDEAYVAVFSLATGRREYTYHLPTRQEQDEIDTLGTGVPTKRVYRVPITVDVAWADKDVLVIRPRDPQQGTTLVLERVGEGNWEPTKEAPGALAAESKTALRPQQEQIFAVDSQGVQCAFPRSLLFGSKPAVVLEASSDDRVVLVNLVPGNHTKKADVVVLRWKTQAATE
jgi:hypothetical protein